MLKSDKTKNLSLWTGITAVLVVLTLNIAYTPLNADERKKPEPTDNDLPKISQEIINNNKCPCGCGRYLPASERQPACFGCSVGKTEVSRILAGLSTGLKPDEITKELKELVLIDVYSDYTDEKLSETWEKVNRLAVEFNLHRVVLRTLGATSEARLAAKLVECARVKGKFKEIQKSMIEHHGPWDEHTLIDLGIEQGMDEEFLSDCLSQMNVDAQIAKDRQHAELLKINMIPAVSVNRKESRSTEDDLRKAIIDALLEGSI